MDTEAAKKKLSEETATTAFQLALKTLKATGKRIYKRMQVENAMSSYANAFVERYGHIKVLGMTKPIPLISIYTDAQIISPHYLYKHSTVDGMEVQFREAGHRRLHVYEPKRMAGLDLANAKSCLTVLGQPGSGKTTFLRRLALEAFLPRQYMTLPSSTQISFVHISGYEHDCLPVYIELRRFSTFDDDLPKLLQKELDVYGFPGTSAFVEAGLKQGRFLFLLDGLDEVPLDLVNTVIEHIRDFSDKYDRNRFIVTCRTAFYKTYLSKYTDVEIAEFDNKQICQFIENWFNTNTIDSKETASRFLDELFLEENAATLEIARTPLLLTFLCLTFEDSQKLPPSRASLYRRALMILLEKWAAEKRIHRNPIYKEFHSDLEIELLADISGKAYEQDRIFFDESELLDGITEFMTTTLNAPQTIDSRAILNAIQIQQGLIIQRTSDIYSFSHLTIQEFLTAHYFNSPSGFGKLAEHLFETRWREVFILLAGMARSDDLFLVFTQALAKFVKNYASLRVALEWVNQIVLPCETPEQGFMRRLFTFGLLLRYIRRDSGNTAPSDGVDRLLSRAEYGSQFCLKWPRHLNQKRAVSLVSILEQFCIHPVNFQALSGKVSVMEDEPLRFLQPGSRHKQDRQFFQTILCMMGAAKDIQNITPGKVGPFTNYVDACALIFDCRDQALRLTTNTWDNVCNRMMRFP